MAQTTQTQSGSTSRATPTLGASIADKMEHTDFANNQLVEKLKNVDVKGTMRDLQQRGREYVSESERYIRANPLRVVLSAAGVGMIIGFLMRGKRVVHR